MKKIFTTGFAILAFSLLSGAQEIVSIPVPNGDMEDANPMVEVSTTKYTFSGGFITLNAAATSLFDVANSGPDKGAGLGMDNSRAFQSKLVGITEPGTGSYITLGMGDIDISANGPGLYRFQFYVKSLLPVTDAKPFWLVIKTYDEDGIDVTAATITKVDNGGTQISAGMDAGFVMQEVSANLALPASGKPAKFIRLTIQHAKYNNTYWFDNFTLTGPKGTSTAIGQVPSNMGVNIYPNPATDYAIIKSESNLNVVSLYSMTGELLVNKTLNANACKLNLTSYPNGAYIIKVTNAEGSAVQKLVVKK